MGLEAVVICLDNSEWMRNGDFIPSRIEAQQDAVNLLATAKTGAHPDSTVSLITTAGNRPEVLITLTQDLGKVLNALAEIPLSGQVDVITSIQVAQLILRNRRDKHGSERIVVFVGSPVKATQKELVDLGKKLKKNGINLDIVNFGEEAENRDKLQAFIDAVDKGGSSHLVSIPNGAILSDVLVSSTLFFGDAAEGGGAGADAGAAAGMGGGGAGGFDQEDDLARALRLSLEEENARRKKEQSEKGGATAPSQPQESRNTELMELEGVSEEERALLQAAIEMSKNEAAQRTEESPAPASTSAPTPSSTSTSQPAQPTQPAVPKTTFPVNTDELSEEEQIRLAMELSAEPQTGTTPAPTSTPATNPSDAAISSDFVNNLLPSLPGVDPNDPRIKNLLEVLKKDEEKENKDKDQPK